VYRSQFAQQLDGLILELGGLLNAHAHVDRFAAADATGSLASAQFPVPETSRLWDKQGLTDRLHVGAAYGEESLV